MIEKQLIKIFIDDKALYEKYYSFLNINYIRDNYKTLYKLFKVLEDLYNEVEVIDQATYETKHLSMYPVFKDVERVEVNKAVTEIFEIEIVNPSVITEYLEEHRRRSLAGKLARIALDVEDGKVDSTELLDAIGEFGQQDVETVEIKPVEMDLEKLYDSQVATQGLRWRVNWLNQSLGSLRKGDFGFIFARPETGKTTFLASEVTHMVSQTEGEVLWFNNEEQGNKVGIRCFQAALNMTSEDLWRDRERNQKVYQMKTGNRIKILDFEDSASKKRIEEVLKVSNPALIIFDQIDKIKGFKAERNDLELKAIYQWARELAKMYAPVIAVSQASGEAEGKLFLTMDMVDGSKTAKQGEADWILGIGKEQDNTSRTRYFNITKNKLIGDTDTRPDLRHGSTQVLIRPEVARYEDV